jgi:hypothetical protein
VQRHGGGIARDHDIVPGDWRHSGDVPIREAGGRSVP